MKSKKIAAFTASMMLIASLSFSAFSYTHCDNTSGRRDYAHCNVKNCNTTVNHKHNGRTYYGHYVGDGHKYYQVCTVKNCKITKNHVHGKKIYLPRKQSKKPSRDYNYDHKNDYKDDHKNDHKGDYNDRNNGCRR